MTLLCLSSLGGGRAGECPVEVAREVALDAAADLLAGFAFGAASFGVGQGGRVAAHAADGDDMQGTVELPVAEPVEAVPVGPPGGHRDRCGAGQHGEGLLAADPAGVGPGQQDLRCAERAHARLGGDQARGHVLHDRGDLRLDAGRGFGEGSGPLAQPDQVWYVTWSAGPRRAGRPAPRRPAPAAPARGAAGFPAAAPGR
jgi:hypothetical protein